MRRTAESDIRSHRAARGLFRFRRTSATTKRISKRLSGRRSNQTSFEVQKKSVFMAW
ncbi:MAG: hypothetical protein IH892_07250 [Planctomycetes bacterium]|nr:hypothetical protein [Planctomycetota bacterium]